MIPPLIFVTAMIVVHQVDGREVRVNPATITQMAAPRPEGKQVPSSVHCILGFTDGRYLSVDETCDAVAKLIEGAEPKR